MIVTLTELLELVGKLDDSEGENTARERFRRHLKVKITKLDKLRDYIEECLKKSGIQYSRALQDLVNHIGHFLGFEVTYGNYQGDLVQNEFDGDWISTEENFHIVIKLHTNLVEPINTSTLIGYIENLISLGQITNWHKASGLYISRDMENNIHENESLVENKIHKLRFICVCVESLLELAEMVNQSILSHQDVLLVLRPSSPRIDATVDLMKRLVGKKRSLLSVTSETVPNVKQDEAGASEKLEQNNWSIKRPRRVRLRRGDATPPKAYCLPILKVLDELGGSAKVNDVLERVEQLMKGVLKEIDYERIPNQKNKSRWRMNCYNARFAMVKNKLLKERSEEGVWEISETGRLYLAQATAD